ncbi:alpha/beta hydrolase [Clostridiaceae bacterium UIB06]|nr:alpha/beta hydrolase [Clostridiaceae bacterium UIB06]
MPYIKLSDLNLYYEEVGIGEPVIFLHNAFSRGILAFSAQIPVLQNKYHCIMPDLRGHGRTKCDELKWTIPQLAEDIIEFINKLELKKVNLIGFSMGGGVAFYIATKCPKLINSLLTIGTASCVTDGIKSNANNFEYHIIKNEEDKNYINLLKHNHFDAHKGEWKSFAKTSVMNWRKYPNITDEELEKLNFPCMFIAGGKDEAIKQEHIESLAKGVKNSKSRVIEDCGHGPHLINEKPVLLNNIIVEFLDENTR